ncbi:hypothetical protein AUR66_17195, partial [Haloferax profundi]
MCLVLSTISAPVGASLTSLETTQSDGFQTDSIQTQGEPMTSESVSWPTLDSGDWPTAGRDPGRSGYSPNASGPKTTPSARWITELSDEVTDHPVVAADGFVLVPGETSVRALNNETGEVVWNVSGVDIESVSVSDGVVVTTEVDYSGDEIRAYRASDGVELWNVTNFEADATVVLDGTLYATRGEYLHAYDVQTGIQQWSTDINEDVSLGLSGAGETVYATGRLSESNDRDYLVYALNASDGSERWRFEMEGQVTMRPVVANDSVYIGSGSSARNLNTDDFDPKLYRLNVTDGHVEWVFDVNSRPRRAAVANGTVYAASGHTVSAHDETTGERVWRYRLPGSIDYGLTYTEMRALSPAVADGVVYAASERGHLVALDTTTGSEQWSYRLDGLATAPAI